MKCPICKAELISNEMAYLETLDEHVNCVEPTLKSVYICSNNDCITRKKESEVYWNRDGEIYGAWGNTYDGINLGPYGSFERKMQVSIYKVGLPDKKYLSPLLLFGIWQPLIEYAYQSNENGDVLKRGFQIHFLRKGKGFGNVYCVHVSLWVKTWKFLWKRFKKQIKYNDYK